MNMPRISEAEWEVMNVLWEEAPLAANQVVERLASRKGWTARTVKTFLNRLVKKGALAYLVEGNRYLYKPNISREESVRKESRSFVERMFAGQVASMLVHFVNSAKLKPEDIERLRQALDNNKSSKGS
jgi:BlaI family transcriptional regulator, penicillinase repressor